MSRTVQSPARARPPSTSTTKEPVTTAAVTPSKTSRPPWLVLPITITMVMGLIACQWWPEISAQLTVSPPPDTGITADELAEELRQLRSTQDHLMLKLGDKIQPETSTACTLACKTKLSAQQKESEAAIAALKATVASLRGTIESQGAERARLQASLAAKSGSTALVATGATLGMEVGALRHQAGRVGKQLLQDCVTAPIKAAATAVTKPVIEGCEAAKAKAAKAKTSASKAIDATKQRASAAASATKTRVEVAKNATKTRVEAAKNATKLAAIKTARAPHHVAAAAARRVANAAEAVAKNAAQVESACADGECHK